MDKKYYWINFVSNTLNHNNEHDINISVHVSSGMTKNQVEEMEEKYDECVEKWGNENDDDFSAFSHHDAIRTAFNEIGVEYEYPKTDYTIYV